MKFTIASLGACALLAGAMPATAQQPAEPAPQAPAASSEQAPSAMAQALDGFHVAILEDSDGGMASVQNDQGENALVVFLEPAAAEAAQQNPAVADMSVAPVPLMLLLSAWNGPIAFEGSPQAIEQANDLMPDMQGSFGAPTFFVLTDGNETQIDNGQGPITPVLLSYADADEMASKLQEQGVEESSISIMPIEFGSVLQELNTMPQDFGYRVFTHPGTVELIQAQQPGDTAQ